MQSLGFFLFSGWILSGMSALWLCDYSEQGKFTETIKQTFRDAETIGQRLSLSLCYLVVLLLFLLVAPFLLVWATPSVAREMWEESRELHRLKTGHQEYLFAWRRVDELPREARRLFDEHSRAVEPLGFQCVGNYRMKELPAGYLGRLFLSEDGVTISSVTQMMAWETSPGPSFSTLLADGTSIDTAIQESAAPLEFLEGQERFVANVVDPAGGLEAAYQSHLEVVRDLCERHETEPLRLGRDQVTDALRYEGRLFSQILHESGRYQEPPPEPELPQPPVENA